MAGIDDIYLTMFDKITKSTGISGATFPYTDIYVDSNYNARIDVALPGYTKDLIKIKQEGNNLIITAKPPMQTKDNIYTEQNIIKKEVKRIVKLSEQYVGGETTAIFENGILSIIIKEVETKKTDIKIMGSGEYDEIINKESIKESEKNNETTSTESKINTIQKEFADLLGSDKDFANYIKNIDKDKFLTDMTEALKDLQSIFKENKTEPTETSEVSNSESIDTSKLSGSM